MRVDADDLRRFVYERIIDDGVVPTVADVAHRFDVSPPIVVDAIRHAALGKTLVLHPQTSEIWMAGPFAAYATQYRVTAGNRSWFANCAWDMLGIATVIGGAVQIDASCTDCGESIRYAVDPETDHVGDEIVHFLLPAHRWYDDLGFT
jgi:hypothetical protein